MALSIILLIHSWLCSTALLSDTQYKVKDVPFEGSDWFYAELSLEGQIDLWGLHLLVYSRYKQRYFPRWQSCQQYQRYVRNTRGISEITSLLAHFSTVRLKCSQGKEWVPDRRLVNIPNSQRPSTTKRSSFWLAQADEINVLIHRYVSLSIDRKLLMTLGPVGHSTWLLLLPTKILQYEGMELMWTLQCCFNHY